MIQTSAKMATATARFSLPSKVSLKEGPLLKRQRGQKSFDLRKLKFQQRYVCLTQTGLEYFDKKKGEKKGDFPVDRIKIIEKVPDSTFQKPYCFQIGDEKEVMYFKADSDKDRKEWLEAFRIAAILNKNVMLEYYHTGAYGQVHQHMWSCCNVANRDLQGCQKTETLRRMTSIQSPRTTRKITKHQGSSKGQEEEEMGSSSDDASDSLGSRSSTLSVTPSSAVTVMDATTLRRKEKTLVSTKGDHLEEGSTLPTNSQTRDDPDKAGKYAEIHPCDNTSIDSGYPLDKFGGSQGSLSSSQSGPGVCLSPPLHRKSDNSHQDTIHEYEEETTLPSTTNPKVDKPVTWECFDFLIKDAKSEITSAIFKGTDTLITASKDGSVHISELYVSQSKLTFCNGVEGSTTCIGVWKHYLALGSSDIQLVDLDNISARGIIREPNKNKPHSHLVGFTPEGQLLSYDQCEPSFIEMWSQVDSSSCLIPSSLVVKKKLEIDANSIVNSLSVSLDAHQPWLSIITKQQLRVYNYSTQELKYFHDNDKEGKLITLFEPAGE